jgi:thioredoxin-dependent peroxiredoxin
MGVSSKNRTNGSKPETSSGAGSSRQSPARQGGDQSPVQPAAGGALKIGGRAPAIRSGAFDLAKLRGKRVVIFFYPKSDTPGCTKEACEFRDASKQFAKANAEIVGISPDKSEAQQKFAAKYSLPFTFVPDPDHSIAEAYGVWKEKSMYGRKYMGIERSTFVIGADGKVEKIFAKVKPEGHAAQVLEALAGL